MDPWVTVATALLGPGGIIVALVTLYRGRNKEKLDERAVQTTEADTVVQMALAQGKAALELNTATATAHAETREDLNRTKLRLSTTQEELDQTKLDLGRTQDELATTTSSLMAERRANDEYRHDLGAWATWFGDVIVDGWETVRLRETHPDAPVLRRGQQWGGMHRGN